MGAPYGIEGGGGPGRSRPLQNTIFPFPGPVVSGGAIRPIAYFLIPSLLGAGPDRTIHRRDRGHEVEFVLQSGERIVTPEVKIGRARSDYSGDGSVRGMVEVR